jgi:uncharacterized iron-regulated membrane protein
LFDASTAEPVEVYEATAAPAGMRLYYAMEPLHFGRLGGAMWVKLLGGLVGLSGGFLSITGYIIYIALRRKRRSTASAIAAQAQLAIA